MLRAQIIIPVYNPDEKFYSLLESLKRQTMKEIPVLIIDSGYKKDYKKYIIGMENVQVKEIPAKDFNHGGTRKLGMDLCPNKEVYIFLTQDAILADKNTIKDLLAAFYDKTVGCAYGRQLPHKDANVFASNARYYNYPSNGHVYAIDDKYKYGMKTAFISNSFAAYRKTSMEDVGGFPTNTILSEDMYVAAKMLLKSWRINYVADACVYHSHNYTIWQEFKRYFDIGVFHSRESWIREEMGQAEGEGVKFVLNEIGVIVKDNPFLLINMVLRDGMKLIGYRLGLYEKYISKTIKKQISMTSKYWNK